MVQAIVLADFVGETEEELTVKEGDIVQVHEFGDDGWAEITINNLSGICPNGYLNIIEEKPKSESPSLTPNTNRPSPQQTGTNRGANNGIQRGGRVLRGARGINRGNRGGNRGGSYRGPRPAGGRGQGPPQRARGGSYRGPRPGASNVRGQNIARKLPQTPMENSSVIKEEVKVIEDSKENSNEEGESKKEKNDKHRQNVITEILHTEKDYVNDIEIVARIFSRPLLEKNIISQADHAALFSNIEVLVSVNQQLLAKLQQDGDELMIGSIFLEMADFFKLYTAYCANQPKSIAALDRLGKDSAFEAFTQEKMLEEECRGLTLFSFLIKPIQRICKYPLLLRDLLKHTDDSHQDYNNLVQALQKIEEVVAYVNDRKRLAENLQKILDVQNQIESNEELNLVEPSRRFMREGTIKVIENGRARERNTFVFNDLIVVTKPRKNMMGNAMKDHFKAQFHLNEIILTDVADTEDIKNACQVKPKNPGVQQFSIVFVLNTPEEKAEWVKEIKTLIREFQLKALQAAKEAKSKKEEEIALGIYSEPSPEPKEKKRSKLVKSMSMKSSLTARASSRSPKRSSSKISTVVETSPKLGTTIQPSFQRPAAPKGRNLTTRQSTLSKSSKSNSNNSGGGVLKSISSRLRTDSKGN